MRFLGLFLILFCFQSLALAEGPSFEDFAQDLEARLSKSNSIVPKNGIQNFKMVIKEASQLKSGAPSEVRAEFINGDLTFIWEFQASARKNPRALLKDYVFMESLYSYNQNSPGFLSPELVPTNNATRMQMLFSYPVVWAEVLTNARAGSAISQYRLAQLEEFMLRDLVKDPAPKSNVQFSSEDLDFFKTQSQKNVDRLAVVAQKDLRNRMKSLQDWRQNSGVLENLENNHFRLNELVLQNDRDGVAKMLEAYLPWVLMEPSEVIAWKTYLEAIRNPNLKDTLVAYRGLDYKTDKVQRLKTSEGERYGFFSTLLTQNQGTYTRRLRSLSSHRDTNGDRMGLYFQSSFRGPWVPTTKVAEFFGSHSSRPHGSTYLSFTLDPTVAYQFTKDQNDDNFAQEPKKPQSAMLAVRMDKRRLNANILSSYGSEVEVLAPLIVFPDEVLAFKEADFIKSPAQYETFLNEVRQKVHQNSVMDKPHQIQYIQQNGLRYFETLIEGENQIKTCAKVLLG